MENKNWHFDGITQVVAYQINWSDPFPTAGILDQPKDKRHWLSWLKRVAPLAKQRGTVLNHSRQPLEGVKLTKPQEQLLCNAVCAEHPDPMCALCFDPHHAFLFLADDQSVLGHIDICFRCNTYKGSPSGFAKNWDVKTIALLFKELEMETINPNWQ